MRRKSVAEEILERILGMRLSRTSTIVTALQHPLNNTCRGLARHQRERNDLATPSFDFLAADDVVYPVGPFYENVRPNIKNGFQGSVFVERADVVHDFQGREKLPTLRLRKDRAIRALQTLNGFISIDGNNQGIAEGTRTGEQVEMSGVEDIEAAVGENDFLAGGLKPANLLSDSVSRMDRHVENLQWPSIARCGIASRWMTKALQRFIVCVALISTGSCTKPVKTPIDELQTFQSAELPDRGPLTIHYQVHGDSFDAPFKWAVWITDSREKPLFRAEHDDRDTDQFFKDPGYLKGCNGYLACKKQWYFEELPADALHAMMPEDHSRRPVESYEIDVLKIEAEAFLTDKGLTKRERASVIREMLKLLSTRFETLYLPASPFVGENRYMYVPSLGYFVPYWHP